MTNETFPIFETYADGSARRWTYNPILFALTGSEMTPVSRKTSRMADALDIRFHDGHLLHGSPRTADYAEGFYQMVSFNGRWHSVGACRSVGPGNIKDRRQGWHKLADWRINDGNHQPRKGEVAAMLEAMLVTPPRITALYHNDRGELVDMIDLVVILP